jgi:NADPH-ferrihemoprotein reductase
LKYGIFGLGNRTYSKFNEASRFVDKKLLEFGARRIGTRGEGDDDGNLEEDFSQWKAEFWKEICLHLNIDPNTVDNRMFRTFSYKILHDANKDTVFHGEIGSLNSWNGKQKYVQFLCPLIYL